jgi:cell division protein FtsN
MAKDYAKPMSSKKSGTKRGAQSSQPKSSAPAPSKWLMFFVVIATVGLGVGLYYLSTIPSSELSKTNSSSEKPSKPAQTKPSAADTKKEPTKPEYDFYNLLPESSITTSPVDAYKPDPSKPKIQYDFMLQTGSFRRPEDAERQKAMIGFQGLRAEIRKVTSKEGSVWYRVEVGPYTSRSKMNSAIDKLVSVNIQPLVKKTAKDK